MIAFGSSFKPSAALSVLKKTTVVISLKQSIDINFNLLALKTELFFLCFVNISDAFQTSLTKTVHRYFYYIQLITEVIFRM